MGQKVSKRECELCKLGLEDKIEALRREIRLAATLSTTLIALFITILGVLQAAKVI